MNILYLKLRVLYEFKNCNNWFGPSAFYTAQSLIKKNIDCEIDIIEKLFCPYGLIRFGVAPDHQSTKNVSRVFERVLNDPKVEFLEELR